MIREKEEAALRQLADEAARAENEACALIADGMAVSHGGMGPVEMRRKIRDAIRARLPAIAPKGEP